MLINWEHNDDGVVYNRLSVGTIYIIEGIVIESESWTSYTLTSELYGPLVKKSKKSDIFYYSTVKKPEEEYGISGLDTITITLFNEEWEIIATKRIPTETS
jgi:hypothetical protein